MYYNNGILWILIKSNKNSKEITNSSLNDVYNTLLTIISLGRGESMVMFLNNFIVKMPEIVNMFSTFYSADLSCYHGYSKMML